MAKKKIAFVRAESITFAGVPAWNAWDDMGRYWYVEYYQGKVTAVGSPLSVPLEAFIGADDTDVTLPDLLYHLGIEHRPELLTPNMDFEKPYPKNTHPKARFRIEEHGGDVCWSLIHITDAGVVGFGPFTEAFAGWLYHYFCVDNLGWKMVKLQKPGTS